MKLYKALIIILLFGYNLNLFSQILWDQETPPGYSGIIREIRPRDYQLYPRGLDNQAVVRCAGTLSAHYSGINFKIVKTTKAGIITESPVFLADMQAGNHFNFEYSITAELSNYLIKYQLILGNTPLSWTTLADKVVCGDAYIIEGQSNATTEDIIDSENIDLQYGYTSTDGYGDFCRSYGNMGPGAPYESWGLSRVTLTQYHFRVGVWGLFLQHEIAKNKEIPTCIINGAQGATSIYRHLLKTEGPYCTDSIFGCLNYRVFKAGLEYGIKAIFWYQGESDVTEMTSKATYLERFKQLYQTWHTYFHNYQKTYVVQIHSFPGCSTCNIIHGFQRELPSYFPDLEVMSSNGILNQNGIHFYSQGYINLGERLLQLVNRDWYCQNQNLNNFTPPNIQKIYTEVTTTAVKVHFEFDQNIGLPSGIPVSKVLETIYINGQLASGQSTISGTIQGNSYIISNSDPDWNPTHAYYLTSIPYNNYTCYLRNANFNDPAYDIGALSFDQDIPFWGSGTVTENYLIYPYTPFSDNIDYASGILSGLIQTDRKAYELFNKKLSYGYAEIPSGADITLKSARRIYLNPGFKANSGSQVKMLVGTDLYAFTNENNCESFPIYKNDLASQNEMNNSDIEQVSNSVLVFPNPNHGTINIRYEVGSMNNLTFEIRNILGELVKSVELPESNNYYTIQDQLFKPGVYMYRLFSENSQIGMGKILVVE